LLIIAWASDWPILKIRRKTFMRWSPLVSEFY